eukprot:c5695_g1_i1.p1 GENE.c5695_g1_i1~~c5695_g1_i1.p1  ORF type:complete len:188 (+),score=20.79 c5695_g1_i1:45-608(+)
MSYVQLDQPEAAPAPVPNNPTFSEPNPEPSIVNITEPDDFVDPDPPPQPRPVHVQPQSGALITLLVFLFRYTVPLVFLNIGFATLYQECDAPVSEWFILAGFCLLAGKLFLVYGRNIPVFSVALPMVFLGGVGLEAFAIYLVSNSHCEHNTARSILSVVFILLPPLLVCYFREVPCSGTDDMKINPT